MGSHKPTPNSIAAKSAMAAGVKRYFLGTPCLRGHISERYSSTKGCVVCVAEKYKQWRIENLEKQRKAVNNWYAKKRNDASFRKKNVEHVMKWMLKNPLDFKANLILRKARKKKADGRFSGNDVKKILERQKFLCLYCQKDLRESGYHIDHRMPISRGGSNWPSNLQCLCPTCNLRKSKKTTWEFILHMDREFKMLYPNEYLEQQVT